MRYAYKIFDEVEFRPKTLFHGVSGSRFLPVGEWIEADIKQVTDGSRQTPYLSGFHAYPLLNDIYRWAAGAKNLAGRVVVRVKVDECRSKPRAIRDTILAERMYIPKSAWKKRISLDEFAV